MKKYTQKTETTTVHNLDGITCDKCGVTSDDEMPGVIPYIETISIYFGYGSKHDGDLFEIELCEDCLEKELIPFGRIYKNKIGM